MTVRTQRATLKLFLTYGIILFACFVTIVPIYWMFVASTVPQSALLGADNPLVVPGTSFLSNLQELQSRGNVDYLNSVWNSVFVSVIFTIIGMLFCSMGGYAFAKFEFKLKEPIFYAILVATTVPLQFVVIPLFLITTNLGLRNSFLAIILPFAAYPIGIFLMRQSMQAIPDSLLESARMDGATELQLFYRIALPTMKSSLAALAVVLFLFQWDLFIFPLVLLDEGNFTIPVAINQLVSSQQVAYSQLMVAASIAIVPMLIVFLVLQRYFIQGILAGSVKE